MSWRPAGRHTAAAMVRFLKKEEWKHATLSTRIRTAGEKPRFGQIADGRMWLKEVNHRITGAIYISRFGVVLPAYEPVDSTEEDRAFLRQLLVSRREKLFSIIGTESRIRDLEERMGERSEDSETYRIFTGNEGSVHQGEHIPDAVIHEATTGDLEALWPLEKAYQLEEVLRKGSVLNEHSGRRHFFETLKYQIVFYVTLNGRPVAKAGTNARGWNWDQIGGVFVIPELRGSGFARVVMTRLLKAIRDAGKSPCLFVKENNSAALGLYRRLEFTDRGPFRISYW